MTRCRRRHPPRTLVGRPFDVPSALSASVWLVFLFYPGSSVVICAQLSSQPAVVLLWGFGALLLFAAVYSLGFGLISARPVFAVRPLACYLGALLVPAVVLAPLLEVWTLTLSPYVMAAASFLVPRGRGLLLGWLLTLAECAVLLALDPSSWFPLYLSLLCSAVVITLSVFAHQAQVDREQLQRELERSAERERIARDVHDLLGHSLTVIGLKAEVAQAHLQGQHSPEGKHQARDELTQISQISRTALAEVRRTVTQLQAPSLAAEIQAAARALRTAGIEAQLPDPDDAEKLCRRHAALFSWGLREGITNVIRHSGASRCVVRLCPTELVIDDDGPPQAPARSFPKDLSGELSRERSASDGGALGEPRGGPRVWGNGLRGLSQRAQEVGGRVHLSEAPSEEASGRGTGGTRLRVVVDEEGS